MRRKYKLTQKKMAEICHISVSSLRKIERNELPPQLSVDIIFYLVFYFKLVPKQLFYSLLELENN
ncbi:helix-turn-helix transcriptional regulator [Acetivibrio sp. MSJd-27]|uniref:helix-turn-helix domain-containing protein n=1 Tax=Acetivibrio sp. MSJd-27 TaxID=2841523 RepID=UPI001C108F02|nr:helix-turn-helix transcriptional regulator [Acetivibrio sp. MSJd-27]